MRRKRRNHLPGFKAKVALAAIKGDRTLAELAEQFDVHQNQIHSKMQELHSSSIKEAELSIVIEAETDIWSVTSKILLTARFIAPLFMENLE